MVGGSHDEWIGWIADGDVLRKTSPDLYIWLLCQRLRFNARLLIICRSHVERLQGHISVAELKFSTVVEIVLLRRSG